MFNSFGNILRLTSFGESHGKGIGGVIDGFPAGITIDMDFVQSELDRRRPGQSRITTSRKESDKVNSFPAFSKVNPPAALSDLSYGTRISTPTIITI